MGGGKSGVSDTVQQGELGLAKQEMANSQKTFDSSFPGFQQSENYYQQLASGDPTAISRATAPAVQQIDAQSQATKQRISQDMPRGGEKNLALDENEINKGAQIGQTATQGYLNSFQNLSSLAGQGVGESAQFSGQAGSQLSTIANQQSEGKAAQLGFITSLAGTAAEAAGAACWIAEALFGVNALETMMIRWYLFQYAGKHWFGCRCVNLYILYGRTVAKWVTNSRWWRMLFRPIFEWLFRRARTVIPDDEQRAIFDKYWDIAKPRSVTPNAS